MLIAVIMAGGSGKRFWPLSRQSNPKQFLRITSEMSMIQMTVDRLLGKIKLENIYIVTADSQKKLVKKHLPDLPIENIILEPQGMNTAPAIALSAAYLARKYKADDKIIVLAADHVIADVQGFIDSFEPAKKAAEDNNLVTFGIKPSYPATGYGYIEAGDKLEYGEQVKSFKEKPDVKTAEKFLKSGNYYWNSGMFMWKIGTILSAYRSYLPKVDKLISKINHKWDKAGIRANISDLYSKMPKIPVDIGIMEQAEKRAVVSVDYGWNDVGSWKALADITQTDSNGNYSKNETEMLDSKNCFVFSEKFTALLGLENIVVVDTPDVLLVADKEKSEQVKDMVTALENQKKNQYL